MRGEEVDFEFGVGKGEASPTGSGFRVEQIPRRLRRSCRRRGAKTVFVPIPEEGGRDDAQGGGQSDELNGEKELGDGVHGVGMLVILVYWYVGKLVELVWW